MNLTKYMSSMMSATGRWRRPESRTGASGGSVMRPQKKLDWFAGCEGEYKRLHLRRRNPPSDRLLQGATGRTISLCETKPVVGADYNHRDHPLKRPFALRCNSTIATPLAMFGLPRHDVRLELGLSVSSADMPPQKSPFSPLRMPKGNA